MSLKLQILNALDQTTRLQEGLLWFTATHPSKNPAQRQICKPDKTDKKINVSDDDYLIDEDTEDLMEVDETDSHDDNKELSCYQRLVQIMMRREVILFFFFSFFFFETLTFIRILVYLPTPTHKQDLTHGSFLSRI